MKTIGTLADRALSWVIPAERASAVTCPYDGYSYWTRCYYNPGCSSGYEKTKRTCYCPPNGGCFWYKYPSRKCC
ncbi:hypothetical protein FH608_015865 [Nonomuraea phyllanthi]|uniref:Uncharacterized protein n=1 Tax=Nonomuraea phyllanthi TaxID=2219224 RepID=A0A5C4WM44_9ACTN|nr:hypothetical protein [Nonomuraea phyllanthi]KAB8194659.1 hypothetical protein FH608_015865 [Nonomuraea phyllanthi]